LAAPGDGAAPRGLSRLWRVFSHLWSFIDFVFGDVLARLAGATWSPRWARYGQGLFWVLAAAAAGLAAPAPWGLAAILLTLSLIIGVARRWSWVEADRARFMIERGKRGEVELAGFKNDLRDEALIGVVCLFLLAPLALSQIHSWTLAAGDPAFEIEGALPEGAAAQWLAWLGFFGAELAKALPFVDWSEVFRIESDSPIDAANAFGAQVVFVTRAALDLLLLAAVLQAVQVASQLRAQREAFDAKELPVLEPFEEEIEFERASLSTPEGLALGLWEQPALDAIGHYDRKRLEQKVLDDSGETALSHRKLAAATLMRQSQDRTLEASAPAIDAFFTQALARDLDAETARWLARMACLAEPGAEGARGDLRGLLADPRRDWRLRAAAARALGRGALSQSGADLLLSVARGAGASSLKLRADAALALAKQGVQDAEAALWPLLDAFRDDPPPLLREAEDSPREAIVTAAHGLALIGAGLDEVAARIRDPLGRTLARRGSRIQATPMTVAEARSTQVGGPLDQTVLLAPGEAGFPDRFRMGAREDEETEDYYPPGREMRMTGPFALGRYAVCVDEWMGFALTFGLPRAPALVMANRSEEQALRWPAADVSWHEAQQYCGWLSRITGERWRLPREAEWEYACRAGGTATYAWGDDAPTAERANFHGAFGGLIPVEGEAAGAGDARRGAFGNAFGLWQMPGNVAEWCEDGWTEKAELNPTQVDQLPGRMDVSVAVLRGGSWDLSPSLLRSAYRSFLLRESRYGSVGFRVLRTL
ncbi:MAG: formylglycine-generating enzyme family protein, partial [Pseudomonadota bacterium]